jgi:hypothetical protein
LLRCCADSGPEQPKAIEPVEKGVPLRRVESGEALAAEAAWLARSITSWLDDEWVQDPPASVHVDIGAAVGRIYARQRMEGEDDVAGVLLAIGTELEAFDMRDAFVGPFNVANKAAELLIASCCGDRNPARGDGWVRGPDDPVWTAADEERRRATGAAEYIQPAGVVAAPVPLMLRDRFERYVFMQRLLDGSADLQTLAGVVAVTAGFAWDSAADTWSADGGTLDCFIQYGDVPPTDVLGDAPLIARLEAFLAEDDETGVKSEALNVVVDVMGGAEMVRILRAEKDEDFRRREVVAKFLHMYGDF